MLTSLAYQPDVDVVPLNDNIGKSKTIIENTRSKITESVYPKLQTLRDREIAAFRSSNSNIPYTYDSPAGRWMRSRNELAERLYQRFITAKGNIRADLLKYYSGSTRDEAVAFVSILNHLTCDHILNILNRAWSENDHDTINFFRRLNDLDHQANIRKALSTFGKMKALLRTIKSGF